MPEILCMMPMEQNLTSPSAMAVADVATENEAAHPAALYDFDWQEK